VDFQVSVKVKPKKEEQGVIVLSDSEDTKEMEEEKENSPAANKMSDIERILKQRLEEERARNTGLEIQKDQSEKTPEKKEDTKKRKRVTSEAKKIYHNK
jgi:hypothetical protein